MQLGLFMMSVESLPLRILKYSMMHLKNCLTTLLIALLLLWSSSSMAAIELTQLYQQRIPVATQNANERTDALQTALKGTLLKVSGDTQALEHDAVRTALKNVRDYVVQYGYQQDEQLVLWVQFDAQKINRLLQQSGSGVWSNLRPLILVWLVSENEQLQRELIGSSDESILTQQLRNAAQERGLPIRLPLLDLNDTMTVEVVDVWARFNDRIQFASARYLPDGIVVARVYQADPTLQKGRWQADWSLDLGELKWRGEVFSDDRDEMGELIIAALTQELAQRYRIDSSIEQTNRWRLAVDGVDSLEKAIQVEQLLLSLPAVQAAQLVGYKQYRGEFELLLQTAPARIMQAIDLSKSLRPVNQDGAEESPDGTPMMPLYRWIED
ncbi:hypothetical protein C9928_02160 [Pseudidiomarina aestuarii]|uniref:DUF2066 domain-containing protein n=1 Tax=Pseudidiomarina aestuarii TaxID=624146 RepID=A0A6N4DGM9_9GAMM|nr:hypothetical protein C9928_02160 [Pseudidiomarina aestuarii]